VNLENISKKVKKQSEGRSQKGPARVHSPPGPLSPAKRRGKEGETGRKPEEKRMSEPRMGEMKVKHIQNW